MTLPTDPLEDTPILDVRQDPQSAGRFRISDAQHREILLAAEECDDFTRTLLGSYRPCTIWLVTPGQETYLELRKPFRFLFFELTVRDRRGLDLGRVERDFTVARPRYSVYDAIGREIYRIVRHPEDVRTFRVIHGERQAALMRKMTITAEEEEFKVPEYFRISFDDGVSLAHRRVLFGALFLVHWDGFGGPRVTFEVSAGGRAS